jgi:hypothetical protein
MDGKYISGTPEIARFDFSRLNNSGVDKTQRRLDLAAEYLWSMGKGDHGTEESPVLFSSLTKKQRLSLVSDYLENVITDAGKTIKLIQAQQEAASEASADYDIND